MNTTDTTRIRSASLEDASFLVPLIAESSGGVWPAVWKALAEEGESTEAFATKYLADPDNDLSVKNTILVESNEGRLGAMTSYREYSITSDASSNARDHSLPVELASALLPYRELSDPNSLFIAEVCLLPEARGKGLGKRLLEHARDLAIEMGLPNVTLRVFSANTGAIRLYERSGFKLVDSRPVIPHPDIKITGSVFLMSCPV